MPPDPHYNFLSPDEPRGRERYYHLEAEPLRAVRDWVDEYERFWQDRLGRLSTLLDEEAP